jgi:hypothetical protein
VNGNFASRLPLFLLYRYFHFSAAATVGPEYNPGFTAPSKSVRYDLGTNSGTPQHYNDANGRVDWIIVSASEGPTYNFVRGMYVVLFNDSWITPGLPGSMLFATRLDKSQTTIMSQAGDWEKPIG